MGIMTRRQGNEYVIGSDRNAGDAPSSRAPKGRPSSSYEVWTGDVWSAEMTDAKLFATIDAADEYVRANFARVIGQAPPKSRSVKPRIRPACQVPAAIADPSQAIAIPAVATISDVIAISDPSTIPETITI